LVYFTDLAKRVGLTGPQEWLGFYFKSPMCAAGRMPEHELSLQLTDLKRELRQNKSRQTATAAAAPR
jgi:myo-inositol-1-phosphate synthase